MPLKMVVYEKKDTKKWVAEINEFETPPDSRVAIVKKKGVASGFRLQEGCGRKRSE